jgi:hypothetical protein
MFGLSIKRQASFSVEYDPEVALRSQGGGRWIQGHRQFAAEPMPPPNRHSSPPPDSSHTRARKRQYISSRRFLLSTHAAVLHPARPQSLSALALSLRSSGATPKPANPSRARSCFATLFYFLTFFGRKSKDASPYLPLATSPRMAFLLAK